MPIPDIAMKRRTFFKGLGVITIFPGPSLGAPQEYGLALASGGEPVTDFYPFEAEVGDEAHLDLGQVDRNLDVDGLVLRFRGKPDRVVSLVSRRCIFPGDSVHLHLIV